MNETKTDVQNVELDWRLPIVGYGNMIDEPIERPGWLYIPLAKDVCIIPPEAIEIVEQIEASGLKVQGFVIAHEVDDQILDKPIKIPPEVEAGLPFEVDEPGEYEVEFPMLDPKFKTVKKAKKAKKIEWIEETKPSWWEEIDWKKVRKTGGEVTIQVVKVTGMAIGAAILIGGLIVVATPLLLLAAGVGAIPCLLDDPVLICVMENGTWVECHRWSVNSSNGSSEVPEDY